MISMEARPGTSKARYGKQKAQQTPVYNNDGEFEIDDDAVEAELQQVHWIFFRLFLFA